MVSCEALLLLLWRRGHVSRVSGVAVAGEFFLPLLPGGDIQLQARRSATFDISERRVSFHWPRAVMVTRGVHNSFVFHPAGAGAVVLSLRN